METFAANLKRARKAAGLRQSDVAEQLNIHRTTYTKYETAHAFPELCTLRRLCRLFDISSDDLLGI